MVLLVVSVLTCAGIEPTTTNPQAYIGTLEGLFLWLSEPLSGTVDAISGSQNVPVIANASDYELGDYEGSIQIASNDPENPAIESL